jgi:opacity protein-like surface antigen
VVTGFAPTIYSNEHVKYVGYAGGIHLGSRRARWEPWAHALFGGGHLLPQTAGHSKNALAITAGGGVDYRLYARLSLRGEVDYVYSRFFSQNQNDFQGFAGIVIHF